MTTPARIDVLDGPWTLSVDHEGPTGAPREADAVPATGIPGRVPGAVHDDLQRAGLIPNPFVDGNEDLVAWASRTDWVYRTTLPSTLHRSAERVELCFDGIDTAARIALGDVELGRTRNMHRSYRFDITDLAAETDLAVHLTSPYTEGEALRSFTGPRPNAYPEPFNFIRKMACSFGWDWGITLPGAGLWRPVRVHSWSTARINHIRPLTTIDGSDGVLTLALDLDRTAPGRGRELVADVALDGEHVRSIAFPPSITDATAEIRVPQVRPWAPVGYGEPNLYGLVITLRTKDGIELDEWSHRIGFRHIWVRREADAAGGSFVFSLGNRPLLVKGANWIPDDIMPGRMTRDRYRQRLTQARDAHVNLIRVWGGGLYETAEFYETCDEFGLMVWQDFPFACAAYPEAAPLRDEILAEAEENVIRLARHPSLVLYNGNNECDWLREAENWAAQPGGEADWGEQYYHSDLVEIVARVDPSRSYTPSSPWAGHPSLAPNAPSHGTFHSWDVWNREDYGHYRDSVPRFVSEFGWQAPPTWQTLREAVTDEPLLPSSPNLLRHQKATDGMDKLDRGLAPHARPRLDSDAWHYLMQWNQVRAITTGIDHWRGHWPVTAGTILWQLNDLWPVISWSAIDGAGRPKPLYHVLRDLYAPRRLAIEPGPDGGLVLVVMNDSDSPWQAQALLRRVGDAGFDSARRSVPVTAAARSVARVPIARELSEFGDPAAEVLLAEYDGLRAWWYPAEPKDSAFTGAPPVVQAVAVPDGLAVTVTATTLLRDFLLQADRMHPEALADRGFLTLLPGESATLVVTCPEVLEPSALGMPWVCSYLDGVLHG